MVLVAEWQHNSNGAIAFHIVIVAGVKTWFNQVQNFPMRLFRPRSPKQQHFESLGQRQ